MAAYILQVNERQLHYLRTAMAQFVGEDPGWEADEFGNDIPTTLNDMLQDELAVAPCIKGLCI